MLKYLLVTETKQNYSIYCSQALTTFILRPLHQVYEKMLNYMNKHMHLLKATPLKWECKGAKGVCLVWVLGVYEEVLWIWKVMGMAPPTWDILANIEDAKEISDYNYRKVYPTSAVAQNCIAFQKYIK